MFSSNSHRCYVEAYKEATTLSRETEFYSIELHNRNEMSDSMAKCLIDDLKNSCDSDVSERANRLEKEYNETIKHNWDYRRKAEKAEAVVLPFLAAYKQFCLDNKITPVFVACSYSIDVYAPENFRQMLYELLDDFTRKYAQEFEQFYEITLNKQTVKPPKKGLTLDKDLELDINGNKFEVDDIIVVIDSFYNHLRTTKIISMTAKYIVLPDSSKISPLKCVVIKKHDSSELKIGKIS